ncbi:MAG TPA: zinc metalloprotease HtpX [Candidatus Diapherotrites archaeon]|uniref:Protease HtpX homolog n=1 Tax=Candidatus Iainarchaeum sp. TaxID=3101447 RepID=A0A7J4IX83_9ARCH|nr:zinc metalloprotease HtpX [Candidatus Diapherotrites archaeon]
MYNQIDENKRNTILLMAFFAVVITVLSWFLGEYMIGYGPGGLFLGGIFAIAYGLISYFFSSDIVLAISGAREVKKEEYPYLFNIIDGLSIAAGIPKPKAYIIDDTALNAFATGRDPEHGIVVFTTGILQKLNRQELEGVVAHEMSHIKNYDIRLQTIITVLIGVTALLSDILLRSALWGRNNRESGRAGAIMLVTGIVLAVLTPIIAQIIRLAISRQREYLADASGAMLTRNPDGLASALEKIGRDTEVLEAANKATAHLYIDNPLKNRHSFFDNLFSTHPPIPDRVARLRKM